MRWISATVLLGDKMTRSLRFVSKGPALAAPWIPRVLAVRGSGMLAAWKVQ